MTYNDVYNIYVSLNKLAQIFQGDSRYTNSEATINIPLNIDFGHGSAVYESLPNLLIAYYDNENWNRNPKQLVFSLELGFPSVIFPWSFDYVGYGNRESQIRKNGEILSQSISAGIKQDFGFYRPYVTTHVTANQLQLDGHSYGEIILDAPPDYSDRPSLVFSYFKAMVSELTKFLQDEFDDFIEAETYLS